MTTYMIIFYLIFVIIFAAFSIAGLYHLWRFGYVGDLTHPVIIVYSVLATIIISLTIIFIVGRYLTGE